MSKNVAVFVDVANIFYAAKAAGVDIDYVTLLKSATAGRDLVRAYAYTGLDPENENQRQFHAFLARNGYKVVSKDIRKYGDGRIKANLDIELVVDLMRLAEHLDIAVVVSGDGDFAPAITAVQQKGVRVEVISFRGNTSSDLIDVADVFSDIAHVAKVEKGARSGRRVAAEGDLSMTEVPDKEAGVTPRRRRARRGEGEERPAAVSAPAAVAAASSAAPAPGRAGLVALPGERLSRAQRAQAAAAEEAEEAPLSLEDGDAAMALDGEMAGDEAGGRRRRRRRGGRGRGRGGRGVEETLPEAVEEEEELVSFADEIPTLPQHAGFGSVWDSQIGVPAAPSAGGGYGVEEDLEGEPEVPEYLMAERRQQGRRRGGRTRGGRQGGGYRSALDRERYGVGGAAGYARGPGRGTPDDRGGGGGRRPRTPAFQTPSDAGSSDPWSEVPPDVQELLRAELARRGPGGARGGGAPRPEHRGAPRTAAAAPAAPEPAPEPAAPVDVDAPAGKAAPRRSTRRKPATPAAAAAAAPEPAPEPAAPVDVDAPAGKAAPRRSTRRKPAASAEAAPQPAAAPEPAPEPAAPVDADAPAGKAPPRRSTRRKPATPSESVADSAPAPEPAAEPAVAKRPTRRRSPRAAAASEPAGD